MTQEYLSTFSESVLNMLKPKFEILDKAKNKTIR